MPQLPVPSLVLGLLLAAVLAAVGLAVPRPQESAQRPSPPDQNFNARTFEYGDWYEGFRERLSPTRDGWPTEVIAQVAEREVERCLSASLRGEASAWDSVLAEGFQGGADLRPATLDERVAREGVTVLWGEPPAEKTVAAGDWVPAVVRLLEPLAAATEPEVESWVTSVIELGEPGFECLMSVRVFGALGVGSRQLNLRWRSVWRVDPDQKRVVLTQLEPLLFEEVVYPRVPFEERTQSVFKNREFFAGPLHQGAVEYDRRYDRTVGNASVYLGMHGIAVGDVNGDGLEDIYVGEQGGVPNRLLLHQPDGTVRERARRGRVDFLDDTGGVLIIDLDGDGHRDIALGVGQNIVLAYNDGTGIFAARDVLSGPGVEQIYSLCAADADGDGDLDLYATRYVAGGVSRGLPTPYHDAENGATNLYWRNEGERRYTLATKEVGLDVNNTRFSLSAIWDDVDQDGDLDLYVANDFGRNNLYRNDGGHFEDIADSVGAYDMAAGMGVTCADVELDGDQDFYVSNMFTAAGSRIAGHPRFQGSRHLDARGGYVRHTQGNTLLLNEGGRFRDVAGRSRSAPGGWAWGAMFTDFDNDGLPDIVVPNGFLTNRRVEDLEGFFWRCVVNASPTAPPATQEYKNAWIAISNLGQNDGYSWNGREPNYAYVNLGEGMFADASGASGLGYRDDGRVASVVDWDMDGRLDLWLKNRTAPTLRFLQNSHAGAGHWVAFDLVGAGANREAAGALVTVGAEAAGDRPALTLTQRSYLGHGYLGSSSRRLHFGLGGHSGAVDVTVAWPDGTQETHLGVPGGQLWRLVQGGAAPEPVELPESTLGRAPARRLPERLPEHEERWVDANGPQVTRVPLLDRMPLTKLQLPAFDGDARTIESYAGRSLLVLLWGSWDDRCVEALESLSARLRGSNVALYPLSMDGVRDEPYVLSVVRGIGPEPLAPLGGRMDARLQLLVEMVLFEVLGPFEDQPLPLGMLFDEEGGLSVLYLGELDPAQVVQDAELASADLGQPDSRWPVAITGGRWALGRGPSRALENLRKFLRKQGFRAVANELRKEQARRAE